MQIPSGKISLLFTDIEGSTKLAQEFPETLQIALDRHNTILNDAITKYNGYVFQIVGDAYCCSFHNSEDALKAAVETQSALENEKWNDAVIKVRIGIHNGPAEFVNNNYDGYITLTRAARVMSVAYGGQIIITEDAYSSIKDKYFLYDDDDPAPGSKIVMRDLGERRLKDVIKPVKLYQVMKEGLQKNFPPLKTLDARPNNIPVQLTTFIGRDDDIQKIRSEISEIRLLSLIGPGGTGKTRLSLQAGAELIDEFENGVWFIELAAITEQKFIVNEIAEVFNIIPAPGKDLMRQIRDYLRDKSLLIVLDNCEHVLNEAAQIASDLIRSCKDIKILTTTREALHIQGEHIYHVPSMSLPDPVIDRDIAAISNYEAVKLFQERAIAVNQNFRITNDNALTIAKLCRELDGIPLAIELAASRTGVLPVEKILERLSDRFKLLTGGKRTSLQRQQTLKALIDWSYDLLSENEKILFRRVSAFNGGWTIEAAESVCSSEPLDEYEVIDLLSSLYDKSLLKGITGNGEQRFDMLVSIKKYSEDKLKTSDEEHLLKKRMFDFFHKIAEESWEKLTSSEQRDCLKKIDTEYENIREALKWSSINAPVDFLTLAISLGKYWELRGNFLEGKNYLSAALNSATNADNVLKAKANFLIGFFNTFLSEYNEAKKLIDESLKVFEENDEKRWLVYALEAKAVIYLFENDYKNAEQISLKSLELSREINCKTDIAANLRALGVGYMSNRRIQEARKMFEDSLAIFKELGDQVQIAKLIGNIGAAEYHMTNYENAIVWMKDSLEQRIELGDRHGIALSLGNLGSAYSMIYDFDQSEKYLFESLEKFREIGDRRNFSLPLNTLGNIANEKKEYDRAIMLFIESMHISHEIGDKFYFMKSIEGLAASHLGLESMEKAAMFSAKYIKLMKELDTNINELELQRISEIESEMNKRLGVKEYERLKKESEKLSDEEWIKLAEEINEAD